MAPREICSAGSYCSSDLTIFGHDIDRYIEVCNQVTVICSRAVSETRFGVDRYALDPATPPPADLLQQLIAGTM